MKKLVVALSFLVLLAMLTVGCATNPLILSQNARDIRTGKADPGGNAKELGPIIGTDGAGCGLYGYRGTYEGAYIRLKNNAAVLGADYVQIYSISPPHLSGNCFVNVFSISGIANNVSPIKNHLVSLSYPQEHVLQLLPTGLFLRHTISSKMQTPLQ